MSHLAIVRHGESLWNQERRFTGWSDVGLSPRGVTESRDAGRLLADAGLDFDLCFTSVLTRGVDSARHTLDEMGLSSIPMVRSWRLNERHFGALQGMGRWDAVRTYGLRKLLRLQRSYSLPPPPLDADDPRFPGNEARYAELAEKELPLSESLEDTYARVIPYFEKTIAPELRRGRNTLIVAHKNSLRPLMKHLEHMSATETPKLRIPTGHPIVYELDLELQVHRRSELGGQPRRRPFWHWAGISPA